MHASVTQTGWNYGILHNYSILKKQPNKLTIESAYYGVYLTMDKAAISEIRLLKNVDYSLNSPVYMGITQNELFILSLFLFLCD